MGVIATAVRHLMAAGVTGEALLAAIEDLENEQPKDRAAENRRAYDRERKAKARLEQKSGGSPVESADIADINTLDKKTPQTPIKINPKITPLISPQPEWLPAEEWEAFEEMRKRIRKPLTGRARVLAIGKLETLRAAGHDPAKVLDQSVLNSWQDLFPPREQNQARAGPVATVGI